MILWSFSDLESTVSSINSEKVDKTSSSSSVSSLLVPGFVVSVIMNIMAGGFFLSSSPSTSSSMSREDNQPYQYVAPSQPMYIKESHDQGGDKMDRLEELRVEYLGETQDYQPEKLKYDNMYLQDIYYNVPRSLYN